MTEVRLYATPRHLVVRYAEHRASRWVRWLRWLTAAEWIAIVLLGVVVITS